MSDVAAPLAGADDWAGVARGLGLLWGLELVRDRATREPLVPFNAKGPAAQPMAALMRAAMDRGLYLYTHDTIVLVAPPLTISQAELREGSPSSTRRWPR